MLGALAGTSVPLISQPSPEVHTAVQPLERGLPNGAGAHRCDHNGPKRIVLDLLRVDPAIHRTVAAARLRAARRSRRSMSMILGASKLPQSQCALAIESLMPRPAENSRVTLPAQLISYHPVGKSITLKVMRHDEAECKCKFDHWGAHA